MQYKESVKQGLIHPDLVKKMKKLKKKCKKKGIFINYSEGFRTVDEQNELYAQGRTKPGHIVTNARGSSYSSQHQWGIAVDFYLNMDVDGDGDKKDDAFNNSTELFNKVGRIAKGLGLSWGGDWVSIKDNPHLYLPDWGSTTVTLKKIYGNPDVFMNKVFGGKIEQMSVKLGTTDIKTLQNLIGVKSDGIPGYKTLSATPTLKIGVSSNVVRWLQMVLNYYYGEHLVEDGIFGLKTEQAVKNVQKFYKLPVIDGVLTSGKNTWRKILGL